MPYQLSSLGGLPYGVGTQHANFPQFSAPTYVGARPSTASPTTPTGPTAPLAPTARWASPVPIPMNTSNNDVYRPTMFGTPGYDGSTALPLTEDPHLSMEDFELSDMVSSPPKEAPTKGKRKGKAKGKGKKKATETEAEADEPMPEVKEKRARSVYTLEESMTIAMCWADISEDPIIANNQDMGGFWGLITDRYEQNKPPGAKSHKPADIRKHWERVMKECGRFNAIYANDMNTNGSGENEMSIRAEAVRKYSA